MTQSGNGKLGNWVMAGRCWCMLGRPDVRDTLDQIYSRLFSYFSKLVSEYP